ncbi:Protein ssh4 [Mucor velutinosus]|uniref:Protein ssh4 n=1 Tax=Mucor velutinosus TaxID=708070 RepID=A0AAN7D6V0_9FUNG|nr:Protein ssh4 [Mucor velutinosus]
MSSLEWTILEKLLLSQAVYKYGEDNWFQVARNLKHHALLDRPSDYFNQKNCSHQYYSMVSELNKEKKGASTNDMPVVVQLARQLYTLRLEELKKAINEDEEKFLTLIAEIDDIRAGKWDNQLLGLSATLEEKALLKEADSTNTPNGAIDMATTASPQPETMENSKQATPSAEASSTSDKQQSPLPSGETMEKLAEQETEAEEAAKVETENVENETRDVRKEDAPPISTDEQQKEMAAIENNPVPSDDTILAASTVAKSTAASDSIQTALGSEEHREQRDETISLKRHSDENEGIEVPDLKRQKVDNQAPFIVDSVAEKLPEHTDMEEDDLKSSKKSRLDDHEPLAIDTSRTDYSTDVSRGTTPADLRDGTESIAGSESNAATPTHERSSRRRDDQRNKSWLKNINLLWREIANHKNGAMFMNPIKENIAPHYYEIVKRPMDLKAVKNRIRDGIITTTTEFERDIVLMLNNSLMYNKEGTEVYLLAKEMLDDAVEQIKIFKMADTDTTASSHTRAAAKKSAVPE